MAVLSKVCKPDNFESHSSLKISFMNIWGLHSNFVDCKSFLESNSSDILAPCEANLDDSIDSGNFSVRGYLLLMWKDSSTHMYGLAVYVFLCHHSYVNSFYCRTASSGILCL